MKSADRPLLTSFISTLSRFSSSPPVLSELWWRSNGEVGAVHVSRWSGKQKVFSQLQARSHTSLQKSQLWVLEGKRCSWRWRLPGLHAGQLNASQIPALDIARLDPVISEIRPSVKYLWSKANIKDLTAQCIYSPTVGWDIKEWVAFRFLWFDAAICHTWLSCWNLSVHVCLCVCVCVRSLSLLC